MMEDRLPTAGEVTPSQAHLDLFLDQQAETPDRLAAAEDLIDQLDSFDDSTQRLIVTTLAELEPTTFLADDRLTPNQQKLPDDNDFLRQTLADVIDQIEPEKIATNLNRLAESWFGGSDEARQQFDQIVVPRLNQVDSVVNLNADSLGHLTPSQQLELLSGVIERQPDKAGGNVFFALERTQELFGSDEAKQLLLDQSHSRPQLAVALLTASGSFDQLAVSNLVDTALEAGQLDRVMGELGYLDLPQAKLTEVIDTALEAGKLDQVMRALEFKYLARCLAPAKLAEVVDKAIEAGQTTTVLSAVGFPRLTKTLTPDKLAEVVDGSLEAGGLDRVAADLASLADHLPPAKLAEVVDKAIEAGHTTIVLSAVGIRSLAGNLPPDKMAEVVDRALEFGQFDRVATELGSWANCLPPDKLVEVVDRVLEVGQMTTALGDIWDLSKYLPEDKLTEIVDRAIESGQVAEVVDQFRKTTDKYGELIHAPPPDQLAVVVDRIIGAGQLAEMTTRLNYLATNLTSDKLAEVVDRFIEAGQLADMASNLKHLAHNLTSYKLVEVVDRSLEAGQVAEVADNFGDLMDYLSQDKLLEVTDRVLEAGEVVNVAYRLGTLVDKLPLEKLAEIVEGAIKAGQINRVIGSSEALAGVFPPDKLVEVIDRAIEADRMDTVLGDLWSLTATLPPDKLVEVMSRAIEADQVRLVMNRLRPLSVGLPPDKLAEVTNKAIEAGGINDVVAGVLSLSLVNREAVMAATEKLTPHLIDIYLQSDTMPSTEEGISQLTSCMELDERTSFAPAYFREVIRRLPRTEGKPSFAILFQEAMGIYYCIDDILAIGDEAKAMLTRIQATIGGGGEAERDGIALAVNALWLECDPTQIETAADAKAQLVDGLNQSMGVELDTSQSGIDQLTEKMGDLMPSLIYASSASQPVRSRLAEIITALASDSYHQHKYPAREQLVAAGVLPPIDEAAYQRWQVSETTNSADIVANTATAVGDKIRQVIGPMTSKHPALEEFNHLPDPTAKLDAIGAALAQLGQQIGAIHRQKQFNEIDPAQAEAQVAALQAQKHQLELAQDAVRLERITVEEVVSGKLHNENGRPTQATIAETLNQLAANNLSQSRETIDQLRGMLDSYTAAATTDIGRISVSDVDDYQTTIEIGANPVGSCQHYQGGSLNQGLLGYFEPGVKIITVRNDGGGLAARAILRLALDPTGSPAMVLEPTYISQASNDIEDVVKNHAATKAANMGIALYNWGPGEATTVTLPQLIAPYGYSDNLGGLYDSSRRIEAELNLV